MKLRRWLIQTIQDQLNWIESCGGTLQGYINNYSKGYGRPVEESISIFEADLKTLREFERRLTRIQGAM